MINNPVSRLNYYSGQALLTDDFKAEQQYHLDLLRLNNASLRTWGIARGLEVEWQPGSLQVAIGAGMSLDNLGREIILKESQVIKLPSDIEAGTYFLTIHYHEVFADLQDNGNVKGYARIEQQPKIEYSQIPGEAGRKILLGVISISDQHQISEITARNGRFKRRYVGSVLGSVAFVTAGTGIAQRKAADEFTTLFPGEAPPNQFSTISAKRESDNCGDYIEIDSARSQFMGALSCRGNVGIGVDLPQSNLEINAIQFKANGTITSSAQNVSFTGEMSPFLSPGDIVISDARVGSPAQRRTVVSVNANAATFKVDRAFHSDLSAATFTYIRSTLARFSSGSNGSLLQVNYDGSVGLGVQSGVNTGSSSGRNALYISTQGYVGIGLGERDPLASLEVQGDVVSNGAVKAASFEGNGAKLKNLPILSYWTKEAVAQDTSKLHYTQGNVGILTTNPPASLSVGGGKSAVGSGFISIDPAAPNKLIGNQTEFMNQVSPSNLITVGKIVPQPVLIKSIFSDTSLELATQVPFVVNNSGYETLAQGESLANAGAGTICSNGTVIIGTGTQFSQLKVGDQLVVNRFDLGAGPVQHRHVKSVESDTSLTLLASNAGDDTPAFTAIDSAYMVTSALLAQFQVDAEFSLLSQALSGDENADATPLPPALMAMANGVVDGMAPNTVAVNVDMTDIQSKYALQVEGDVSFSGGGSNFENLSAENLTVTKQLTVAADGSADNIMAIGEQGATPLLNVSKTNVQIGQQSTTASSYALDVAGDISASSNIIVGQQLQAPSADVTNVIAKALTAAGTTFDADGTVSIFAARSQQGKLAGDKDAKQYQALTDGFVVALIGIGGAVSANYLGAVTGQTATDMNFTNVTGSAVVSTHTVTQTISSKKSTKSITVGFPGSFCMPVRKGEYWKVQMMAAPSGFGFSDAPNEFYFVPLGPPPASGQATGTADKAAPTSQLNASTSTRSIAPALSATTPAALKPAAPDTNTFVSYTTKMLKDHEQNMANISAVGTDQPSQEVIDKRMSDLTDVLSKATPIKDTPSNREQFLSDLSKIVCSVNPENGGLENKVSDSDIAKLVATFSDITGRKFTPEEEALLSKGVNALVEINANDENRHNLGLIKNNINTFIDAMQSALHSNFSDSEKRLITRALVRLVGDGSQASPQVSSDVTTNTAPSANSDAQPVPVTAPSQPTTSTAAEIQPKPQTEQTQTSELSPHHAAVKGFINSAEKSLETTLDATAKNVLHEVVTNALSSKKPVEEVAHTIVEQLEKSAEGSLKASVKTTLLDGAKRLLASLL